jgi:multicomponent Na+:H+ antiporter subunit B
MIQAHDSVIVRTLGRIVIPIAQVFGIYVLVFGNYGPGGGFVGGVILAASMILAILTFGRGSPHSWLGKKVMRGDGVGLLIIAGLGGLCLIGGGQFLNYSHLQIPGLDEVSRRYLGIMLIQVGVAADVAVTGLSIAVSLSGDEGENEEVAHG